MRTGDVVRAVFNSSNAAVCTSVPEKSVPFLIKSMNGGAMIEYVALYELSEEVAEAQELPDLCCILAGLVPLGL